MWRPRERAWKATRQATLCGTLTGSCRPAVRSMPYMLSGVGADHQQVAAEFPHHVELALGELKMLIKIAERLGGDDFVAKDAHDLVATAFHHFAKLRMVFR